MWVMGLPIGGVLATKDAIIPYAVGVDIACRVSMTIFDASPYVLGQKREKFRKALEELDFVWRWQTLSNDPDDHPVMDDPLFNELRHRP